MKKVFSILITLILLLSFTTVSLAVEAVPDVMSLFENWETNGYPDDVGGVYYDDATGGLVIGLVGADEARRAEILSMVEDTDGVSFSESQYAHNEMLAAHKEISGEMSKVSGKIYSVGVGWTSINGVVTGFGESGKEFRVVVSVDKSVFDEYVSTYGTRYGDMVYVEAGEAPVSIMEDSSTSDPANSANTWLLPAIMALLILASLSILIMRRPLLMPAAQTTNGTTVVTSAHRLSRKDVVKAVKQSEVSPSEAAHKKLMNRVNAKE